MTYVASTKDRTKLVIADADVSNAIIFEQASNGDILVSSVCRGIANKQYLVIDNAEAKQAIMDYISDHL